MRIHVSSVVSPLAVIANDVHIGPFCIIEQDVVIGEGCRLDGRVTIKQGTHIGTNNIIHEGVVLGGLPQHVAIRNVDSRLIIGNDNVFRENVTVHKSMKPGEYTEIGNGCYFMVNAHVGHDCRVADNVTLVNNVLLGGHVTVETRAILSGAAGVHQFTRIGEYAMCGGQAHITQDVPPFTLLDGLSSRIVGLNLVGLRRNGFSAVEIREIKEAYRIIFRSQLSWEEKLQTLRGRFAEGPAARMTKFLEGTQRGIVQDRLSRNTLLRVHNAEEAGDKKVLLAKAG